MSPVSVCLILCKQDYANSSRHNYKGQQDIRNQTYNTYGVDKSKRLYNSVGVIDDPYAFLCVAKSCTDFACLALVEACAPLSAIPPPNALSQKLDQAQTVEYFQPQHFNKLSQNKKTYIYIYTHIYTYILNGLLFK